MRVTQRKILLVGTVPSDSALETFELVGPKLGEHLTGIGDGETGMRRRWISWLAIPYRDNPSLETVRWALPVDPDAPDEWREPGDDWVKKGYADSPLFRVKPGAEEIHFAPFGYADAAQESYALFRDLRDQGILGRHLRFTVSFPLTESATRPFLESERDFEPMWRAYEDTIRREIALILEAIPADDLIIQFDVCHEVIAVDQDDQLEGDIPWEAPGDPLERYLSAVTEFAKHIPSEVVMGLHLCYGDLGHKHVVEPQDLGIVTRMANAARAAVTRPIDFYHMPVPRDRTDDAYFEPLGDLDIGEGKLFLGLVHHTDGLEGTNRRIATAKRHIEDFGISTECGWGRRRKETIPELIEIHRKAVNAL